MPIFSRLLHMAVNPRAVIARLDRKRGDYLKVIAVTGKAEYRTLDQEVLLNAEEFVAIHTQLLEELPRFLEGYTKILDLALGGFAMSQTQFLRDVGQKLRTFMHAWTMSDAADKEAAFALDGPAIVRRWHATCKPFMDALEHLEILHRMSC